MKKMTLEEALDAGLAPDQEVYVPVIVKCEACHTKLEEDKSINLTVHFRSGKESAVLCRGCYLSGNNPLYSPDQFMVSHPVQREIVS